MQHFHKYYSQTLAITTSYKDTLQTLAITTSYKDTLQTLSITNFQRHNLQTLAMTSFYKNTSVTIAITSLHKHNPVTLAMTSFQKKCNIFQFFAYFFRPIYIGRAQIQMSVGASKSGFYRKTGGKASARSGGAIMDFLMKLGMVSLILMLQALL